MENQLCNCMESPRLMCAENPMEVRNIEIELLLIAVSLSMDAFAVSVCKGLSTKGNCTRAGIITGAWFGSFQALMPLMGYLCGAGISKYITAVSKYIAWVLLSLIGINMIRESVKAGNKTTDASISPRIMLPAALATSIDAFAVGITLAALQADIVPAVLLIGCTAFIISCVGVHIGNIFGSRFEKQASVFGGVVLIGIGLRILIAGS